MQPGVNISDAASLVPTPAGKTWHTALQTGTRKSVILLFLVLKKYDFFLLLHRLLFLLWAYILLPKKKAHVYMSVTMMLNIHRNHKAY